MQTEVAKTLEDLGVSPRSPGGKRLGAVLQMLLRFPHVILQDWRSMFLVPDDFLLEPLSAIWNTPTPLRDKIFAYALQQPGQPLPSLDWMAETLCDAIRSRPAAGCRAPPTSRVQRHAGSAGPTAITGGCRMPFRRPPAAALSAASHVTGPAARWVGWADGRNGRLPDAFPLPSSSWLPGSSHVMGPATRWVGWADSHNGWLPGAFPLPSSGCAAGLLPRHGSSDTLGWQKRNKCAILGID